MLSKAFDNIDEAFFELTDYQHLPLWEYGRKILIKTSRGCGIPISIGIAPTKTLAKIASRFAKKHLGYKSVCVIDNEEKRVAALKLVNVGDIWGVGSEYEKLLKRENIKTAYDLSCMPKHWVRKNMTVVGEKMWLELHGVACFEMELEALPKKQICNSNSFGEMVTDLNDLKAIVARFADEGAKELRQQGSSAFNVLVYVTGNPYRSELPDCNRSIVKTFGIPTNSSLRIVKSAVECVDLIYKKGDCFKSAGVILSDFVPESQIQLSLYDSFDIEKHSRLMQTTDIINRDGIKRINLAVEGVAKSKLNGMSNRYSTRSSELLHINCYS